VLETTRQESTTQDEAIVDSTRLPGVSAGGVFDFMTSVNIEEPNEESVESPSIHNGSGVKERKANTSRVRVRKSPSPSFYE